jgi:hypothetical protein
MWRDGLDVGATWLDVGATWLDVGSMWRDGLDVGATWLDVGATWLDVGDVGDVSTVPRVLPHLGLLPRTGQNACCCVALEEVKGHPSTCQEQ